MARGTLRLDVEGVGMVDVGSTRVGSDRRLLWSESENDRYNTPILGQMRFGYVRTVG
jgi:hypothetical protein